MLRLSHDDGTWQGLQDQWAKQCREFDEDFESYMPVSLPTLANQVEVCAAERWTGVFGHANPDGEYEAVCFLNGAFIPNFSGRVLRVRHLTLAPKHDFGDYSEEGYARILTEIFESVLSASDSQLPCPHVKFHFRSPADLDLFREFATHLNESERFSAVKMVGSWLIVNKA